jgi:hypothetical protein
MSSFNLKLPQEKIRFSHILLFVVVVHSLAILSLHLNSNSFFSKKSNEKIVVRTVKLVPASPLGSKEKNSSVANNENTIKNSSLKNLATALQPETGKDKVIPQPLVKNSEEAKELVPPSKPIKSVDLSSNLSGEKSVKIVTAAKEQKKSSKESKEPKKEIKKEKSPVKNQEQKPPKAKAKAKEKDLKAKTKQSDKQKEQEAALARKKEALALLQQSKDKLQSNQVQSGNKNLAPSQKGSLNLPSIGKLNSEKPGILDGNPYASGLVKGKDDASLAQSAKEQYDAEVQQILKDFLELPEKELEAIIKITILPNGRINKLTIIETYSSQKNKSYLEKVVPSIILPPLYRVFPGEKEYTPTIRLQNVEIE